MDCAFRAIYLWLTAATALFALNGYANDENSWIEGWQTTEKLTTARAGAAVIATKGIIHALGGIDGVRFLNTTEMTHINNDETLSAWQTSQPLNIARGFFDAAIYGEYLYVVGGGNGPSGSNILNSIERAYIKPDGSLGPWQMEKHTLVYPRRCSKVAIINNYIYTFGGYGGTLLDSVERAEILADGSLGPWRLEKSRMTMPRYVNTVKRVGNKIYVIGGHDQERGIGLTEVEWAQVDQDGHLNRWQKTNPLMIGRYGLSAAKYNNTLYAMGGLKASNYLTSIEKTKLEDNGSLGVWQNSTALPLPLANFSSIVYNKSIYLIGGTNSKGYFNTVYSAQFDDQGEIGYWGKPSAQTKQPAEVKMALPLPNNGLVKEIIQTDSYTYLLIDTKSGDEWLAASSITFKNGDKIHYSEGIIMEDFFSKTLKRRFKKIRFVSRVELNND